MVGRWSGGVKARLPTPSPHHPPFHHSAAPPLHHSTPTLKRARIPQPQAPLRRPSTPPTEVARLPAPASSTRSWTSPRISRFSAARPTPTSWSSLRRCSGQRAIAVTDVNTPGRRRAHVRGGEAGGELSPHRRRAAGPDGRAGPARLGDRPVRLRAAVPPAHRRQAPGGQGRVHALAG